MQNEIELLKSLFLEQGFEQKTLKIQGEKVYRVQIGGLRHYRRKSGGIYKSLTTFLSAVMPSNRHLENWKMNLAAELGSREAVDEFVGKTADYGSALHIAAADYCRNNGVDWLEFEQQAHQMLADAGLSADSIEYALPEFIKDFACLVQFFHDYRVTVLAVEIPVWMEEGVATLIDLVVEMDAKNYDKTPPEKRERHHAIINLKSGKKGFFESHIMQLVGERMMFNHVYSESLGFEIEHVYNLAPSDWKEKPSYKIKNQTETIGLENMAEQFKLFLQIGKARKVLTPPSKKYPVFTGRTNYGENPCDALTIHTYDEFSKLKIEKHHANNSKD